MEGFLSGLSRLKITSCFHVKSDLQTEIFIWFFYIYRFYFHTSKANCRYLYNCYSIYTWNTCTKIPRNCRDSTLTVQSSSRDQGRSESLWRPAQETKWRPLIFVDILLPWKLVRLFGFLILYFLQLARFCALWKWRPGQVPPLPPLPL